MKRLFVYVLMPFILLISCSKDDITKEDLITYKLILKAKIASEGTTVFSDISYKKADGTLVSLTNRTTSFEESFTIANNFNIYFKVTGVYTGTRILDVSTSYEVQKYVNGVQVGDVEYSSKISPSRSSLSGSWSFVSLYDTTFKE